MILLPLFLLAADPAQSTAAERAGKFALDLSADDGVTAPAEAKPADAAPSVPAAAPAPAKPGVPAHFSLDTPIAALIDDPRAKAVLDKDMPGLTTDENLPRFRALTLRQLAPLSGGQMTAELMSTLAFDLAALGGGTLPPGGKRRAGPTSGR